ncbi:MAG: type 4a pilus biogenesis protein PilO [Candidatus Sumerlaeia bacterium]|nr:type 4a pilus biogenesis protein PilO [Candidatus Sumerlaeia bacterium]
MFSKQDKKILQAALVGGGIAVVGLIYYVMVYVSKEVASYEKAIKTSNDTYKKKQAELDDLRRWEQRKEEINALVNDLMEKVKRLPRSVEASDFFRILRDCVHRTNLSEIKVGRLKTVDMGAYNEIPYMVSCRARYHDLGQFLALIEQHSQQIMRIKTMDVYVDMKKRPSRHHVNLQIATFVFTEPVPRGAK